MAWRELAAAGSLLRARGDRDQRLRALGHVRCHAAMAAGRVLGKATGSTPEASKATDTLPIVPFIGGDATATMVSRPTTRPPSASASLHLKTAKSPGWTMVRLCRP